MRLRTQSKDFARSFILSYQTDHGFNIYGLRVCVELFTWHSGSGVGHLLLRLRCKFPLAENLIALSY